MMRIITLNANGIRAAARKGLFEWLSKQNANVICIQETKAQLADLEETVFCCEGYHCYYCDAKRKGYSGVAVYCREEPKKVITGLGWASSDEEGRYIQVDYADLSIASIYFPSGSSGEARQAVKFDFMKRYYRRLKKLKTSKRQFILCGDWNIVHRAIDIKNFKSNQKNSGCLPEERAWLDTILTKDQFVDAFREVNQEADQYTWWSNRGRAWEKNVGWRIDYQILTPGLRGTVRAASIYKSQRFSDHAPLIVDYEM